MLFIPISFVAAILLLILWAQGLLYDGPLQRSRPFQALLLLYAVLSVLIGIRWGYGVLTFLPIQSVLAATWVSLAWLSFRSLSGDEGVIALRRDWPQLLPSISIVFLIQFWPEPIDVVLIGIYFFYGLALLRMTFKGQDFFKGVRLAESWQAHLALKVTTVLVLAFACVDVFISYEFRFGEGRLSGLVVALANVPALLILGYMASVAGGSKSNPRSEQTIPSAPSEAEPEDKEVLEKVDSLLRGKEVYRDFDLSLDRLARKSGITGRRISNAINRIKGLNVSQYVNEYRVEEVCRLLSSSDQPVTTIMFDAGFQTKSNFNREFRRVTGLSPKQWRDNYPAVAYKPV